MMVETEFSPYLVCWLAGETSLVEHLQGRFEGLRKQIFDDRSTPYYDLRTVVSQAKGAYHNVTHVYRVLRFYGMRPLSVSEYSTWIDRWGPLALESRIASYLKYWCAGLFSYMTNQELPKKPEGWTGGLFWILSGRTREFVRRLAARVRISLLTSPVKRGALRKAQTFQNLKKGMYRVDETMVEATLCSHREGLTADGITPRPSGFEDDGDWRDLALLDSLDHVIEEVFEKSRFHFPHSIPFPSIKGHYGLPGEGSQHCGGAASYVRSGWQMAVEASKEDPTYWVSQAERFPLVLKDGEWPLYPACYEESESLGQAHPPEMELRLSGESVTGSPVPSDSEAGDGSKAQSCEEGTPHDGALSRDEIDPSTVDPATWWPESALILPRHPWRPDRDTKRIILSAFGHYYTPGTCEDVQEAFADWVWDTVDQEAKMFLASPIAICEPLKVRVVTCGPAVSYWLLRPVQQFFWQALKEHPCFTLVGQPASAAIMERLGFCDEGEVYVSADYKAATDNLLSRYCQYAAERACRKVRMPYWLTSLTVRALIGHYLDYEEMEDIGDGLSRKFFRQQRNGQLMGSPVSFPFLNLLNAAYCRAAILEDRVRSLSSPSWAEVDQIFNTTLRELRLLCNGDDAAFTATLNAFKIWQDLAKFGGLEPSMGKTYVSAWWVQINSQIFRRLLGRFESVPFINLGHVGPYDPKGGKLRTWRDLGSLSDEFLGAFPKEEMPTAAMWFIRDHRSLLDDVPEGMNWFLPKHLGGTGLFHKAVVRGDLVLDPGRFSFRQLELANLLKSDRSQFIDPGRPQAQMQARWQQVAKTKIIPYCHSVVKTSSIPDEWSAWIPDPTSITSHLWRNPWNDGKWDSGYDLVKLPKSRGNFHRLWRRSKGKGHGPLGLYLLEQDRVVRPKFGAKEFWDDLTIKPVDLYERLTARSAGRVFQQRKVQACVSTSYVVRPYGMQIPLDYHSEEEDGLSLLTCLSS